MQRAVNKTGSVQVRILKCAFVRCNSGKIIDKQFRIGKNGIVKDRPRKTRKLYIGFTKRAKSKKESLTRKPVKEQSVKQACANEQPESLFPEKSTPVSTRSAKFILLRSEPDANAAARSS